jgi:hypothetical protein
MENKLLAIQYNPTPIGSIKQKKPDIIGITTFIEDIGFGAASFELVLTLICLLCTNCNPIDINGIRIDIDFQLGVLVILKPKKLLTLIILSIAVFASAPSPSCNNRFH